MAPAEGNPEARCSFHAKKQEKGIRMGELSAKKLLLISPFRAGQRGNSVTAVRLKKGFQEEGLDVELLSLDEGISLKSLADGLAEKRYALVHGLHALHFSRVTEMVPALKELPLILTLTGTDINFDLHGERRQKIVDILHHVRKIVVFNEDFCKEIIAADSSFKDKLVTVPQGVFLPEGPDKNRTALGFNKNDFVFALPSGLRPVKNIAFAIDSLTEVHKVFPHTRLLMMGQLIDHEYGKRIIKRIKDLPWVRYLGEIPHEEIRGIFRLCDVVLNTSLAEGQPQGVLEAMSLGIPCIMTAVPGNLNIITNGIQGFYVESKEEFIRVAETLILNETKRKAMGEAGRSLVEAKFTLKQEVSSYIKIYREVLCKR